MIRGHTLIVKVALYLPWQCTCAKVANFERASMMHDCIVLWPCQAALDTEEFELAAELLRFLMPPGESDAFVAAACGQNGAEARPAAPPKAQSPGVRWVCRQNPVLPGYVMSYKPSSSQELCMNEVCLSFVCRAACRACQVSWSLYASRSQCAYQCCSARSGWLRCLAPARDLQLLRSRVYSKVRPSAAYRAQTMFTCGTSRMRCTCG